MSTSPTTPTVDLPPTVTESSAPAGTSPGRRARRDRSPAEPRTRAPGRPSNRAKLGEALDESLVSLGTMVALVDEFDGLTIVEGAPRLSAALLALGDRNPAVMRALERMTEASGWGGVIAAVLPIAIPIAAHHGLLPSSLAREPGSLDGVEPNDLLTPAEQEMARRAGVDVGALFEQAKKMAANGSSGGT